MDQSNLQVLISDIKNGRLVLYNSLLSLLSRPSLVISRIQSLTTLVTFALFYTLENPYARRLR